MYVWSHGCTVPYAPDNSLEYFARAAAMGAEGAELDVQYTRDGRVVVIHDATIDRTSNAQGRVCDYTYEELLKFDFSQKKPGFKDVRIPTLEQVFELLGPTNMVINVEIKAASYQAAKACVDIAAQYGMTDRVIYSAADHYQLVKIHEVEPNAMIAPLYRFHLIKPWLYCTECLGATAIHPTLTQIKRQPGYIDECHARGIRVHPAIIDTEEDIRYLWEAGTDAIITNLPDFALEVIAKLEAGN